MKKEIPPVYAAAIVLAAVAVAAWAIWQYAETRRANLSPQEVAEIMQKVGGSVPANNIAAQNQSAPAASAPR
jgi:predicted negative regulator of RcsB-dependent stress response